MVSVWLPGRTLLLIVAAYFLGSIPFGLLLARLFGKADVRQAGSGNIGAANVTRVAGPVPGIFTLLLDTGKGALALWLAAHFSADNATSMMLAGIFALLGHCFPVWLRFRGGKGVATALGVFLALCSSAALSALAIFLIVVAIWRYVSLGSVAAAAAMPLLMYLLWAPPLAPPLVVTFGTLFATGLVIFNHRGNLQRLLDGTEPRFTFARSRDASE
jgi:acyl phosphate:glycerol-3-phosphate acyltransferase